MQLTKNLFRPKNNPFKKKGTAETIQFWDWDGGTQATELSASLCKGKKKKQLYSMSLRREGHIEEVGWWLLTFSRNNVIIIFF